MSNTGKRVLRHFLSEYISKLEQRKVPEIHPFFRDFFTKTELASILLSEWESLSLKEYTTDTMNTDDLLEILNDDKYILSYFLKKLDKELQITPDVSPVTVWHILEQVGLQTHYLGQKAIALWDEYDHSNYRNLQRKAGKIVRVYGIYDKTVTKDEVYTVDTKPKRYFETKELATEMLDELVLKQVFKQDEVHIHSLYIPN